jgi:hypothetical protein
MKLVNSHARVSAKAGNTTLGEALSFHLDTPSSGEKLI